MKTTAPRRERISPYWIGKMLLYSILFWSILGLCWYIAETRLWPS